KKGKTGIYLSTCVSCQGLIDELAQDVVDEALIPVWESINSLKSDVSNIYGLINNLQAEINSIISSLNSIRRT
ncbi:hypothetical protein LCGC14_1512980, partial [marine sediment metagenome]